MGWGYIDKDGKWAIEPTWERAGRFREGRAWVSQGGKLGYIDTRGELVVPAKFANTWQFSGGMAQVSEDGMSTCVIDPDGNHIYAGREETIDGVTLVARHDRDTGKILWGAMNTLGEVVLPLEYARIWRSRKWLIVQDGEIERVFDLAGEQIYEAPKRLLAPLRHFQTFDGGFIAHYLGEPSGILVVLDADKQVVRELYGDRIDVFDIGPVRFKVHSYNNTSIPEAGIFRGKPSDQYFDADFQRVQAYTPPAPTDGIRIVQDKKDFFVHADGERVAGPFAKAHVRVATLEQGHNGPFCVWVMRKEGKRKLWGTLDRHGQPAIPPEHDVRDFQHGMAALGALGCMGLVGADGHWAIEPAHTVIRSVGSHSDRFVAYVGGKAFKNGNLKGGHWALFAMDGTALTEPVFADVGDVYSDGLLAMCPV